MDVVPNHPKYVGFIIVVCSLGRLIVIDFIRYLASTGE